MGLNTHSINIQLIQGITSRIKVSKLDQVIEVFKVYFYLEGKISIFKRKLELEFYSSGGV